MTRFIDADALRDNMQWCIDHGMYDKPYDYLSEIDDAPTVGEWIPVSEKPKENGEYIASLEDSVYPQASFFNGKWFMRSLNGIAREFGEYEVIAWQPMPEPYKAESEDKE